MSCRDDDTIPKWTRISLATNYTGYSKRRIKNKGFEPLFKFPDRKTISDNMACLIKRFFYFQQVRN